MKKLLLTILIISVLILSGCAQPYESDQRDTENNIESHEEHKASHEKDNYEDTWGELEDEEGEVIWDTLSDDQQALVNYPPFDETCVYWTPNGKSYHAVDWCYALSNSNTINSGTLDDAFGLGKTDPCSKCVGE